MKHALLSGVAVLFATSAFAADMPAYAPEPAVAPAYDWSGFYIGAHGGWAFGDTDDDDFFLEDGLRARSIPSKTASTISRASSSAARLATTGSGTASFSASKAMPPSSIRIPTPIFEEFGFGVNFLASARGRIGLAFDRFLIYGTGGAAFAGVDLEGFDDDNTDFFGWVAGGGIEYAFTDNVTFGVEFLHYEFGDEPIGDETHRSRVRHGPEPRRHPWPPERQVQRPFRGLIRTFKREAGARLSGTPRPACRGGVSHHDAKSPAEAGLFRFREAAVSDRCGCRRHRHRSTP